MLQCVAAGDAVVCRVGGKSQAGLMLSLLCLHPATGKSRLLEDLRIRCFCAAAELLPARWASPLQDSETSEFSVQRPS